MAARTDNYLRCPVFPVYAAERRSSAECGGTRQQLGMITRQLYHRRRRIVVPINQTSQRQQNFDQHPLACSETMIKGGRNSRKRTTWLAERRMGTHTWGEVVTERRMGRYRRWSESAAVIQKKHSGTKQIWSTQSARIGVMSGKLGLTIRLRRSRGCNFGVTISWSGNNT